ncbi:AraC family transcriptional regulator [Bradyrhizobium embrapense]|uniref:AraC family transcriptional regulator n=1 Tax=Bradyrhizobium embrapense TaxID=630921 RepID=UPI000B2855C9|nr:AraC family transcriptional regulator [Bradyrhizobium embrapense]
MRGCQGHAVAMTRQESHATQSPSRMLPGFAQRIFPPHSIAAIAAELRAQGIDPSEVLDGTGLVIAQLESHTTRISYRQLDTLIRNALRLTRDPAIALRSGARMHVTAYGMYGYALLSSATHAEARDFAARYIRVVGPFCDFGLSYAGETVVATFQPMHWPNPTESVHRFAVEFALAAHLTTVRDRSGQGFGFSRVLVDYATPPSAATYRDLFGCPVLFNQHHCGYEYARNDGPRALANPRTHAMAREMCEEILSEVNRAGGVAADIRRILIEQPGRYPSIEAIAEQLDIYPRALRRRLEAEGTSYRSLLSEVRMRLAIEYLRKTRMTNEEIASRLGYSDAANFRHAFLRWTGRNPSEFRGDEGL